MSRWAKRAAIAAAFVALLATAGFAFHRHVYPFGWSHCCDKLFINEPVGEEYLRLAEASAPVGRRDFVALELASSNGSVL